MTLLELMIAIAVISLALLALMSLIYSSSKLQQTSREKTLAYNAARQKLEEMRNWKPFSGTGGIYDHYKTSLGKNTFTVQGLNAIPAKPVGQIFFPETTGNLSENPTNPPEDPYLAKDLGMPKDLDWDGDTTNTNVSTTYKIIPVKIRIQWQSIGNVQTKIEVCTLMTQK